MPTPPYHPAITGPDPGPPFGAVLLAIAVAFVIAAMLVRIIVDWAMTLRDLQRQPGRDEPAAECDDGRPLPCPGCGGRGCCPDCDDTGDGDGRD